MILADPWTSALAGSRRSPEDEWQIPIVLKSWPLRENGDDGDGARFFRRDNYRHWLISRCAVDSVLYSTRKALKVNKALSMRQTVYTMCTDRLHPYSKNLTTAIALH